MQVPASEKNTEPGIKKTLQGFSFADSYTKIKNELYTEVLKLLSQSYNDLPAILPFAMLPRQDRITRIKTVHFVS